MYSPGRPSRPALGRCRFRPGLLDRRAPSHARPASGVCPDRPESQARRTPSSLALPQEHFAPGMAQHGPATYHNPPPRACPRNHLRRLGCPRRRSDRQPDAEQGRQLFRTPRLDPPRLRQLRLVRPAVPVASHPGRAEILVRGGRLPRPRRPCPGAAWSSLRLDLPSQPDHRQRCQRCGHSRAEVSTGDPGVRNPRHKACAASSRNSATRWPVNRRLPGCLDRTRGNSIRCCPTGFVSGAAPEETITSVPSGNGSSPSSTTTPLWTRPRISILAFSVVLSSESSPPFVSLRSIQSRKACPSSFLLGEGLPSRPRRTADRALQLARRRSGT